MTTKTRIVRIGNSRGIRVPKLLLDQAALPDEVELRAEPGRVVELNAHRRTVIVAPMTTGGRDYPWRIKRPVSDSVGVFAE